MIKLLAILIILVVFFCGLGWLVHICSKNNYSLAYESTKRKFEIYPNKDNPKFPHNQSNE